MSGWVTCQNLYGEKLPIRNGEYGLYTIDRETGQRRITYKFNFTGKDGKEYFFSGYKVIVHEPWRFDILEDQTTLFATITRTDDGNETVVAQGIIHYHVEDFPDMLFSIRTPKDDTIANRVRMATRFFAFVSKEISEYIREINFSREPTTKVSHGAIMSASRTSVWFCGKVTPGDDLLSQNTQ